MRNLLLFFWVLFALNLQAKEYYIPFFQFYAFNPTNGQTYGDCWNNQATCVIDITTCDSLCLYYVSKGNYGDQDFVILGTSQHVSIPYGPNASICYWFKPTTAGQVQFAWVMSTGQQVVYTINVTQGDCGNTTNCCPQGSINISTGIDNTTGSLIPIGTPDDTWTITAGTGTAVVATPHSLWADDMTNSQWLGSGSFFPFGVTTYQTSIVIPPCNTAELCISWLGGDDEIDFLVDGVNYYSHHGGWAFKDTSALQNPPITLSLGAGTHILTVNVNNMSAGAGGFLLEGCYSLIPMPSPEVSITPHQTICEGQCATITATGGGTYQWSTGETTPSITVCPSAGGLGLSYPYEVTVTNAQGCTATAWTSVTVNPRPVVTITGVDKYCAGANNTLTATGGGTYQWSNGATTATTTINAVGTYCVTVTNMGGNLITNGDFSAGNTGFTSALSYSCICQSSSICVANEPRTKCANSLWIDDLWDHTVGTSNGKMLIVDGLPGRTIWQQSVSVIAGQTYTFSYWNYRAISNNGSQVLSFRVNGAIIATFNNATAANTWIRYAANWTAATSTSVVLSITEDGGIGYDDYAIDDISFQAIGCSTVVCKEVKSCCSDMTINFKYQTSNAYNNQVYFFAPTVTGCSGTKTYFWEFGDGTTSTLATPGYKTYSTCGEKTVCVTVTCTLPDGTSCVVKCCKKVFVAGYQVLLNSNFGYTVSASNPLLTSFSAPSNPTGTTHLWTITNSGGTIIYSATTATIPSYIFPTAGTYKVCLTTTSPKSSCVSMTKTQCKDITLYAACNVTPRIIAIQNSATSPFTVILNNSTVGTNTSWEWNFGDGSPLVTTSNTSHTYTTAGTYTVCLTVNKGQNYCEAKVCMPVYVGTSNCFTPSPCGTPNIPCDMTQAGNQNEIPSHVSVIDKDIINYDSEKIKGLEPSVYPNPTDGSITVLMGKNVDFDNMVTISDMRGQTLTKLNINKGDGQAIVDMSDFAAGIYLVTIRSSEGKLTTMKVIRE